MKETNLKHACKQRHAEMVGHYGYKFCPHCGERIKIIAVCDVCGRRFASEKARLYHVISNHRKPSACPDCGNKRLFNEFPIFTTRRGKKFLNGFMPAKGRKLHSWHCQCGLTFQWRDGVISNKENVSDYDFC